MVKNDECKGAYATANGDLLTELKELDQFNQDDLDGIDDLDDLDNIVLLTTSGAFLTLLCCG